MKDKPKVCDIPDKMDRGKNSGQCQTRARRDLNREWEVVGWMAVLTPPLDLEVAGPEASVDSVPQGNHLASDSTVLTGVGNTQQPGRTSPFLIASWKLGT